MQRPSTTQLESQRLRPAAFFAAAAQPRAATAASTAASYANGAAAARAPGRGGRGDERWRRLQMERLLAWKDSKAQQLHAQEANEAQRQEKLRKAKERKLREAEAKRAQVLAWKDVKRKEVEEQVQQASMLTKKTHTKWARVTRASTVGPGSFGRLARLAQPKGIGVLPRVPHEAPAQGQQHESVRPGASPLRHKTPPRPATVGAQPTLPLSSSVLAADTGAAEPVRAAAEAAPDGTEASRNTSVAKVESRRRQQKEELRLWRQQQDEVAARAAALKEKQEKARQQAWKDRAKALREDLKKRAATAAKGHGKPAPVELPPQFQVQLSRTQTAFAALRRDFEEDLSQVILAQSEPAEPEPEPEPELEADPARRAIIAQYKVVVPTTKFTVAFSVDSEMGGELTEGEVVEVLEIRRNARGQARLRLYRSRPDLRTDDEGNSVEVEAWTSEATWPAETPLLELLPPEKRKGGASDFQFREGGGDGTAWDKRFLQQASEGSGRNDEWYVCYEDSPHLQEFMHGAMDPDSLVVQVGCGNSRMAPALYKDGFKYLINLDISRAVLAHMQTKYGDTHPGLSFIAGDATQTGWPSEVVDVIVDKGTLQSLLLLRDGVSRVQAFAREMWRILRPGGKMIQIMGSSGMQMYLKLPDLPWAVKHKVIPRVGIGGKANIFTFIKPIPTEKLADSQ
jgi:SAM-dependent methyltransferase